MKRRVVITGLGPVSPIGKERETFWHSLVKGISGIKKIDRFADSDKGYRTFIGGEIKDFSPLPYLSEKEVGRMSLFTQMSIVAANLALSDAHLKITENNCYRTGIVMGTGIGGIDSTSDQVESLITSGVKKVNPLAANSSIPHAAAGEISVHLKIMGPNFTISTGCSASANAIGVALDWIRSGRVDVMLAGGAETPLVDVVFATFDNSKQLSTKNDIPEKAVTPFDLNRDGFILSEGSAVLVLEELEHALNRGAHIYGELVGYGSSADAYNSFQLQPSGQGMAKAMEFALKDADVTPVDIDYICAHGSGSVSADRKETNAIKLLFEEQAKKVPISTIKSVMGMPFGASSGFQTIASLLMIENQTVIPTMNLETPDPECDLDYIPNKARQTIVNTTLVNSMGLGGNNAVLVLKKYEK